MGVVSLARLCRPPGRARHLASVAESPVGLANGAILVCTTHGRRCRHTAAGSTAAAFSTSSLWRRLPVGSGLMLVSCDAVVLTSVHYPGLRGSSAVLCLVLPDSAWICPTATSVEVEVLTTARGMRQTADHHDTTVYLRVPVMGVGIDATVIVVTTDSTAALGAALVRAGRTDADFPTRSCRLSPRPDLMRTRATMAHLNRSATGRRQTGAGESGRPRRTGLRGASVSREKARRAVRKC